MKTLASNSKIIGADFNIYRFRFIPIRNIETKFTEALNVLQTRETQALIPSGVNVKNKCGDPPLRLAIYNGQTVIAQALLATGAYANIEAFMGYRLVHVAASTNKIEILKLLLENEANMDTQHEWNGITPLHLAIINNHVPIVQVLISAGANVTAENIKLQLNIFVIQRLNKF